MQQAGHDRHARNLGGRGVPATAPQDTYDRLNAALGGQVIPDIGQVTPGEKRALDQAVRAGQLAKWRGKWFPVAGASFGIGPDKTCWGLPSIAEHFASFNVRA